MNLNNITKQKAVKIKAWTTTSHIYHGGIYITRFQDLNYADTPAVTLLGLDLQAAC